MRVFAGFSGLIAIVAGALASVSAGGTEPVSVLAAGGTGTVGGQGGAIVRVTNLNAAGPGSFRAAVETKGKRIVVFEVGGIIDLARSGLVVSEPYLTIAGQTAPSPGITIIRGGIDLKGHDVIIRHIRVRTGRDGQAALSGWEADAFSGVAAHDVIVDHCSFTWGIDENMSASGPRFAGGNTVAAWRQHTSRNFLFSYNLAAEGLANASHPKGEHSKGSLIHDNATGIVFWRNIWAHNVERSPLLKGGAQAVMVNNLIYDPGKRAVHYNLMALEWAGQPYVEGRLTAIGNVMRAGPSTDAGLPFLMLGGDGDLRYFGKDNIAVDKFGTAAPMFGRYGETRAQLIEAKTPDALPAGVTVLPVRDVETHVLANAGARPWDRDADDIRVLFFIAEGRGAILDDEKEVGGYPKQAPTKAAFVEADWNLVTMEPKSGLYPGQKAPAPQEHLSVRDKSMREAVRK
ncbi:pectate lyase [Polymorphobacter glacialis]|uniref:Pectate lyase n=1 Tax=Sandarakinorhabdus glacialis TaxID=1614636 RepID=A0A917ECS8_9SPHN|nr:pectate lyase [Polymorphobacter glacialis]GGE19943.1 pectate lyase [Polymorphobacter glacialis]